MKLSGAAKTAQRLEFLLEASAVLAASLDVESNLAEVARLAVPLLGDWCFCTVADSRGGFRQLEIGWAGDSIDVTRLKRFTLFREGVNDISPRVILVTPEWCELAAEDSEHAALLRRLCGGSAIIVPLAVRERRLGVLTFIASTGGYGRKDVTFAGDLGRRCALALENARLYAQVLAERDEAEKANRAKDEFLAVLSHELRNPLMPLLGWTRVLRNQPRMAQDPLLAEGLCSMERNARTLERLVGDCLDLARISEGGIRMERKPVDLSQVVAASIESVREMASAKRLRLVPEILPDSVLLLGDAVRLEQVIVNLLVNAVKYTGRGGSVSIRCSRVDHEAEIEVTDTGAGIQPSLLGQIFEPFRRGSDSWLSNQSGLGLGLAIARRIVEMHGGRIWAESAGLDAGSTFRVRLPMAPSTSAERTRDLSISGEFEGSGLQILIIEDSEDILFLLKIELEMSGHTVSTASDGNTGLAMARKSRPDLIISDIKMPGMDGLEFIREIRASPELALTPAIALTGFGGKSEFDRAVAAGFDACVTKPAEPREISALIRKLTEKKHGTHGP